MVTGSLTDRMGLVLILCSKIPVTIVKMLNFDHDFDTHGDGEATYKQTLTTTSVHVISDEPLNLREQFVRFSLLYRGFFLPFLNYVTLQETQSQIQYFKIFFRSSLHLNNTIFPALNLRNPLHAREEACKRGIHSDFEKQGIRHH